MMYLSYCPMYWASRNKLEESVNIFLRDNTRKLIYAEDLEDFKSKLQAGIEAINKKHPRCAPVKIEFYTSVDRHDTESVDFFISWNDTKGSNGHKLCDFKILASR